MYMWLDFLQTRRIVCMYYARVVLSITKGQKRGIVLGVPWEFSTWISWVLGPCSCVFNVGRPFSNWTRAFWTEHDMSRQFKPSHFSRHIFQKSNWITYWCSKNVGIGKRDKTHICFWSDPTSERILMSHPVHVSCRNGSFDCVKKQDDNTRGLKSWCHLLAHLKYLNLS